MGMLHSSTGFAEAVLELGPDNAAFVLECRYYEVLEADHITFIIDKDRAGVKFDILYDNIFQRCRKEMQRTFGSQRETGNEVLRTVSTLSEKSLEQSFGR
jgi:hypothetical protein